MFGLALVVATSSQSPPGTPRTRRAPAPPRQTANVALATQDGAFIVIVSSFGKKFTVDSNKLRFTVASANAKSARVPLAATVGDPVFDRSLDQADGTLTGVSRSGHGFRRVPPRWGMYDLAIVGESGFVRYAERNERARRWRSPRANVYWPDAGTDPGSVAARAAIEGRTVYGFGGIVLELRRGVVQIVLGRRRRRRERH